MGFVEREPSYDGYGLPYTTASRVRQRKGRWLWPERVPLPAVCMIAGRGGSGKSTLCAALAASVTAGVPLPGSAAGPKRGRRGTVLWFGAEESLATHIRPRLRAAGCNLKRVLFPGLGDDGQVQHFVEFPADLSKIRDMASREGATLAVLDPLSSYTPGVDLNQQQQVRQLLGALRHVGEEVGMTWLIVSHPNKSRTGPILDRIFASAAFHQFSRSVLLVGQHPSADGSRVVVHAKTNDRPAATLRFYLEAEADGLAPRVRWVGECPVTADMLGVEALDAGEQDQHLDARSLLRSVLKEPMRYTDLLKEATNAGVGERSLRTAKAEYKIKSQKIHDASSGSYWVWCPPEGGWEGVE